MGIRQLGCMMMVAHHSREGSCGLVGLLSEGRTDDERGGLRDLRASSECRIMAARAGVSSIDTGMGAGASAAWGEMRADRVRGLPVAEVSSAPVCCRCRFRRRFPDEPLELLGTLSRRSTVAGVVMASILIRDVAGRGAEGLTLSTVAVTTGR